jgi:hypothetical protein
MIDIRNLKNIILAATFAGTLMTSTAIATPITVTGFQMTVANPDIVLVNNQEVYAGEVTLDTTSGPLLVWCLDIFDDLATGQFVSGLMVNPEIAGLMLHADAAIANGGHADVSAAFQIKIWEVEYPNISITVLTDADAVNNLIAGFPDWTSDVPINTVGAFGNQTTGNVDNVPEPATMAVFGVGLLGLVCVRKGVKTNA